VIAATLLASMNKIEKTFECFVLHSVCHWGTPLAWLNLFGIYIEVSKEWQGLEDTPRTRVRQSSFSFENEFSTPVLKWKEVGRW
jgi:hypothetical protein